MLFYKKPLNEGMFAHYTPGFLRNFVTMISSYKKRQSDRAIFHTLLRKMVVDYPDFIARQRVEMESRTRLGERNKSAVLLELKLVQNNLNIIAKDRLTMMLLSSKEEKVFESYRSKDLPEIIKFIESIKPLARDDVSSVSVTV
jgi:hypothetical protein